MQREIIKPQINVPLVVKLDRGPGGKGEDRPVWNRLPVHRQRRSEPAVSASRSPQ